MKVLMVSLFAAGILSFGIGVAGAADPMSEKEASPTLKERIMKDAVKGTLMKVEGEYYWIKDEDGKTTKVHVDKSTKLDKVVEGDKVKAYITDKGHTTTLQRLD
ncbi:hypothetical protein DNFV4_03257 [Nitrospira tepida]|uniref:Uncharacterized protein n=2 Tax=Nitrospira tepida TaxID=2973512 RepID=A0AA86N182_9BACT|nr:hypothetical protein DNFV4_03257 [Nitrospira tepida]